MSAVAETGRKHHHADNHQQRQRGSVVGLEERSAPARTAATMAIGASEYDTSLIRCIRRSSISAVKSTQAIFANSDGWN